MASGGDAKKRPPIYRIALELEISALARAGGHWLRVVTPRGVSNGIRFDDADRAVTMEEAAKQAGDLALPVLINGRLEKPGETDLFAFQAGAGRLYWFEIVSAENFEPRVGLLSSQKSWFDGVWPRRVLSTRSDPSTSSLCRPKAPCALLNRAATRSRCHRYSVERESSE